jgi:hypothetical protein
LLESGFNPHTSSHGLSGAELTRLPLNAPTSNQKSNCNASAQLTAEGALPRDMSFDKMQTLYRLTSAGWSVIHRSDLIAICALLISAMSLSLAIFGIAHRP